MQNKFIAGMLILAAVACTPDKSPVAVDYYGSQFFQDVQLKAIFPDSKTFVDCTPRRALEDILADYDKVKAKADFDLEGFVKENFDMPVRPQTNFHSDTTRSLEQHLTLLWDVLTRKPDDYDPRSSLIPLPHPYIVPGGRFSEIYYWDSYFTMLGLAQQNRYDMIRNMVDNFTFLIDSIGFIPNGNRNYYLGRSQPPFYSLMVEILQENDSNASVHYLEPMVKEYNFWMEGVDKLNNVGDAEIHVVKVDDSTILNRYWDKIPLPRPEAFKEDYNLAASSQRPAEVVYRNLRAAAESGIDFSSRWFKEGEGLSSIHTIDFIPVDLNGLLYHLEMMIADGYSKKGDDANAASFKAKASRRAAAVLKYCWDPQQNYFVDYDFVQQKKSTIRTLLGAYAMFFELATPEMADGATHVLETEFLKPGGFVTSNNATGEQWDSPNGWAPLEWMAYKGLVNYNKLDLADEMASRWLRQNQRVYKKTGRMMEKYNVMDTTLTAGGGEYPNQDGFGWTNGVCLKLLGK